MCTFKQKTKGDDSEKQCNASYIGSYYVFATVTTAILFAIVVILSLIFGDDSLEDYKKGIVLFTNVFFALLFVVSLIAMFREVSRLQAREFPLDTINRVNKLQNELNELQNKRIANIEKDLNELKNSKVTLD